MEKTKTLKQIKKYIALAVFLETAVNAVFSLAFHDFMRFFYSDYAHLTVWGDVVAIVSVVFSFIIYDSFAHFAYHKRKDRVMFLGVVYVASKAASIIHYAVGLVTNLINTNALETVPVNAVLSIFEVVVDVVAAIWLIGYFEKKFKKEETEENVSA